MQHLALCQIKCVVKKQQHYVKLQDVLYFRNKGLRVWHAYNKCCAKTTNQCELHDYVTWHGYFPKLAS